MRNAQKKAVMAMFAALETAKEAKQANEASAKAKILPFEAPPAARAIAIDPLWLAMRGAKGRA